MNRSFCGTDRVCFQSALLRATVFTADTCWDGTMRTALECPGALCPLSNGIWREGKMPVSAKCCQACIRSYARKWECSREKGRERGLAEISAKASLQPPQVGSFSQTPEQGHFEHGQRTMLVPDAIQRHKVVSSDIVVAGNC